MPQDRRFPLLIDRDFSEPAPLLEIFATVLCQKLVVKADLPQVTNRDAHLILFPVEQRIDLSNV